MLETLLLPKKVQPKDTFPVWGPCTTNICIPHRVIKFSHQGCSTELANMKDYSGQGQITVNLLSGLCHWNNEEISYRSSNYLTKTDNKVKAAYIK